jgi:hypothetical protein
MDEFNDDNFDHAGLGFHGGGFVAAGTGSVWLGFLGAGIANRMTVMAEARNPSWPRYSRNTFGMAHLSLPET